MLYLQMLDPVTSMHQLQSQLRSRRCFSRSTGATSESDVRQSPSKKAKVSSSSSSTSLPELGSTTDHDLNVVKTNGFCDYTETATCTTRPVEPQVTSILFPIIFTFFWICITGGAQSCVHAYMCVFLQTKCFSLFLFSMLCLSNQLRIGSQIYVQT